MSEKKKLSRFEKKFKKAREKGKETFKFRKKGESIFKKRGVYHTRLEGEGTGKEAKDSGSNQGRANLEKAVQIEWEKRKRKEREERGGERGIPYKKGGVVRDMFTQQYD